MGNATKEREEIWNFRKCRKDGKGMIFTTSNFQTEVLDSKIPVIVDFYAQWCGPCKMMAPLVEKMAQKFEGSVKIGKMDVEEAMEIAQKYRVTLVPTFVVFKDGQAVEFHEGGMSSDDLEAFVQKYVG